MKTFKLYFQFTIMTLLATAMASCTNEYSIEGASSVSSLDGRTLSIKVYREGKMVTVDSAEVIHGLFRMKGKLDSVQLVTLYLNDSPIMPIVLEAGKINVKISTSEVKAEGTSLNDKLYEFIEKKNRMDLMIEDIQRKEARMVMNGAMFDEIHEKLAAEHDRCMENMMRYVKTFIIDNADNVLGPGIFLMVCATMDYPIMTQDIEDILKETPDSFKQSYGVREFLKSARYNTNLIKRN